MLNRTKLINSGRRRYKLVPLPDGDTARIQTLNEAERSDFEKGTVNSRGRINVDRMASARRRLVAKVLVDEEGRRLFDDDQADLLRQADAAIVGAIYDAAVQFVGISNDDVEEEVKNSARLSGDDSSTPNSPESPAAST